MSDIPDTNQQQYHLMIHRWSVWYRLRRASSAALKGMLFGLSFALGLSVFMVVSGQGVQFELGLETILIWLAVTGFSAAAVLALIGFLWPLPPIKVAKFYDQFFNLQERASTAFEILERPGDVKQSVLTNIQLQDTLHQGTKVKPDRSFFWTAQRNQVLLSGVIVLVTSLLALAGGPYFQRVAVQQQITQAIDAEISRLEELQTAVENQTTLSEDDKNELTQSIEETIRKLEQADSIEEAVAVISSEEAALKSLESQDIQKQAEALKQLGNQIQQSESTQAGENPLDEFGQALASGDPIAAGQSLNEIDLENLSSEERRTLADQLHKSASTLADTNPELANQMEQAAQALENGDLQSAKQAMENASQELAQAGSQIAQSNAIQEITSQTSQSTGRLLEAGRNALGLNPDGVAQSESPSAGQGQSSGNGSGSDSSQSGTQSNGNGSNDQGNNQGSGSGSGKGSTDQSSSNGSEAGVDPINQNNGPGDGGERSFVPMNESQRLDNSNGYDVYLPESNAPGEEVTGQTGTSPGTDNNSTVPYIEVYPAYEESYRQAIESGSIPASLRNLVKKYFSNLEP